MEKKGKKKKREKKIYICKEDHILIVPLPLARDLYRLPFVFLSANYTADDNWGKVFTLESFGFTETQ